MDLPVTDNVPFIRHLLYHQVDQSRRIADIEQENAELRTRLSRYELLGKDSQNSCVPPSQESIKFRSLRRTRFLRKASARKTGGQYGYKGLTREINPFTNCRLVYSSAYCKVCGASLADVEGDTAETPQSVDILLPICPRSFPWEKGHGQTLSGRPPW